MPYLSLAELTDIVAQALRRAGANRHMALTTAQALVVAEAEGLPGHGLSRVALYAQHLKEGRADGRAKPRVVRRVGATCLIDAGGGLAFPAAVMAGQEAMKRALRYGVAYVGVNNSHHFGAAAYHLAPLAAAKLVGIALTNSPAAINAWGGRQAFFGTNPIAAIFPRRDLPPIVIDLSLTEVTRGKIMLMAKSGQSIPLGWAVDRDGQPTTDAKAALTGSLTAIGGVKGTALALMVEVLCVALTGAGLSVENDSYFEAGSRPRIGHGILAINPAALAGEDVYYHRIEDMVHAMLKDVDVRLPGVRRQRALAAAETAGIEITDSMYAELKSFAKASR